MSHCIAYSGIRDPIYCPALQPIEHHDNKRVETCQSGTPKGLPKKVERKKRKNNSQIGGVKPS